MRHDNSTWRELVRSTYVLVRDDLDVLHVSSGLKDLSQDFLGDPRVQSTNVQGSLVGLRGGAPDGTASAHRGHNGAEIYWSADLTRHHVVVVGNVERRWHLWL